MKKQQNKKKILYLLVFSLLVVVIVSISLFLLVSKEYYSKDVVTQETINTHNKLMFYKDDCSDCEKIIPKRILINLFTRETIFINLNQEKNKSYIKSYSLKEVPTLVYRKGDSNDWKSETCN